MVSAARTVALLLGGPRCGSVAERRALRGGGRCRAGREEQGCGQDKYSGVDGRGAAHLMPLIRSWPGGSVG